MNRHDQPEFQEEVSDHERTTRLRLLRLRVPEDATTIIGHTRLTTQGKQRYNENNHPWRSAFFHLYIIGIDPPTMGKIND